MSYVKKHIRKGKNKASVVRKHHRKDSMTHRTRNGRREVFVDGFWKPDAYGDAPTKKWSIERLQREKEKLTEDFFDSLHGINVSAHGPNPFPARKYGLLTRRIKKINRLLKQKQL